MEAILVLVMILPAAFFPTATGGCRWKAGKFPRSWHTPHHKRFPSFSAQDEICMNLARNSVISASPPNPFPMFHVVEACDVNHETSLVLLATDFEISLVTCFNGLQHCVMSRTDSTLQNFIHCRF